MLFRPQLVPVDLGGRTKPQRHWRRWRRWPFAVIPVVADPPGATAGQRQPKARSAHQVDCAAGGADRYGLPARAAPLSVDYPPAAMNVPLDLTLTIV